MPECTEAERALVEAIVEQHGKRIYAGVTENTLAVIFERLEAKLDRELYERAVQSKVRLMAAGREWADAWAAVQASGFVDSRLAAPLHDRIACEAEERLGPEDAEKEEVE